MGSELERSRDSVATELLRQLEAASDRVVLRGDAMTLSLLRTQASLEGDQLRATLLWWLTERTAEEPLAAFLARRGVASRSAVRTLDMIPKGYLQSGTTARLIDADGRSALLRELAERAAPSPAEPAAMKSPEPAATKSPEPTPPDGSGSAEEAPEVVEAPPSGEASTARSASSPRGSSPRESTQDSEALIGQTLGQYHVVSLLGRGAKGLVYEATDVLLNRPVALKVLAPEIFASDATAVRRFLLEARTASRLDHPNCVGVFGVGKDGGRVWLAMTLVRGGSAQDRLRGGQRLPVAEATRIVEHAARGLHAAHCAGIIHRDIKPGNILLGEAGEVRITDFGMAKATDDALGGLTEPGRWLGTPHFMSPEQCRGLPVDVRADLYSLGATYFNLVTGRPPFADHPPLAVLYKQITDPHPDPRTWAPDLPDEVVDVIDRAMSKEPADRFADAAEMAAALREVRRQILLSESQRKLAQLPSRLAAPAEPGSLEGSESATEEGPTPRVSDEFAKLARRVGQPPSAVVALPPTGAVLGRCQLEAEIGRGSTAVVFRARHVSLDIAVAVKVLLTAGSGPTGVALRQMLAREARLLARLNHPNIVRVLDFDEQAEQPYLVLEFVEGDSLKRLLARRGRLGIAESVELIRAVTEALAHADRLGILHRDVKPGNILLNAAGVPKLADLGLAELALPVLPRAAVTANWWESVHRSRAVVGTPAYMSPEQAVGAQTLDRRSDIYSLGVTLFQCLTGRLPFEAADTVEMMKLRVKVDPISPAEVRAECGPELSAIVLRMLARRPADRYASYEELLGALDGLSLRSAVAGSGRAGLSSSASGVPMSTRPGDSATEAADSAQRPPGGWGLGSFLSNVLGRSSLSQSGSTQPFPKEDPHEHEEN